MFRKIAGGLVLMLLAAGPAGAQTATPIKTVRYSCDYGRSLVVEYFSGATRTLPDGMPMPGGHVMVTQGDGTRHTLQQTGSILARRNAPATIHGHPIRSAGAHRALLSAV